jgi:hypothetical protein
MRLAALETNFISAQNECGVDIELNSRRASKFPYKLASASVDGGDQGLQNF